MSRASFNSITYNLRGQEQLFIDGMRLLRLCEDMRQVVNVGLREDLIANSIPNRNVFLQGILVKSLDDD